ncbi:MAG TPA: [FeFe] hydrogenase H-cluster maturation GTPase HydF [Thermotogota bacterium]|nr:[FeFe] hydrogenase H-cluster maturation GTPase HydF [Thermotogota bacterium]HPJ89889.1 [FeFe] hydrogenase H-cluster maturation GTPase HydF [Thermotogota bacterium]HPR95853.1 [FeFe] hydrogenase H-cluster maturation GTPase HydF [Thermotogota bacterium]
MRTTPNSNRITIGLFGRRNAGKSQLMNTITSQNISVVSPIEGTTTDPVKKAMEFIPVGPVLFIDTAGIDDFGELGSLRVEKTQKMMHSTDFGLYVIDAAEPEDAELERTKALFKRFNVSLIKVVNKIDTVSAEQLEKARTLHPDAAFVSAKTGENIFQLKEVLIKRLQTQAEDPSLIGDLVDYGANVVMVVPVDSEAPKGRLILPQVQMIRDCLDNGIKCHVVRDVELADVLRDLKKVDLVITDSQAFKEVSEIVPEAIPLTSFSILFTRQKGDLNLMMKGVESLNTLEDGSRVLISEACTHNVSCEDIGRFKLPRLLKKKLNRDLNIEVIGGKDFPVDLKDYDLVIHCGGCMLNRKGMQTRLMFCEESGVPVTNYGTALAWLNGIFDRATEIFR